MIPDVLPYLRCPACGGAFTLIGGSLRCAPGHGFDLARQGFVQLTTGPVRHPGDSAEMVAARARFLDAGHYDPLTDALVSHATGAGLASKGLALDGPVLDGPALDGLVLDAGAGTGHHLAAVLRARPDLVGLAVDSSRAAARRAARAHPRAAAIVCDTWDRLPVADGSVALLLNVFAPRHPAEFRRVLAPGGTLLVVAPEPEHLTEVVTALDLLRVDPAKPDRLAAGLGPLFAPPVTQRLRWRLRLDRDDLRDLVAMGPSAWHTDPGAVDRLAVPLEVTASVRLHTYRIDTQDVGPPR